MNLVDLIYGKKQQPAMPAPPPAPENGASPMLAYGGPQGMTHAGNIDMTKLLPAHLGGQNWGTVYSSNNEINGKETVYPGIVNGVQLSDEDARRNAIMTGRHLGEFSNSDDASNYAEKLHKDWERPGIMGLSTRDTPIVGAPYPSSQYAPTEEARKKFKIKK